MTPNALPAAGPLPRAERRGVPLDASDRNLCRGDLCRFLDSCPTISPAPRISTRCLIAVARPDFSPPTTRVVRATTKHHERPDVAGCSAPTATEAATRARRANVDDWLGSIKPLGRRLTPERPLRWRRVRRSGAGPQPRFAVRGLRHVAELSSSVAQACGDHDVPFLRRWLEPGIALDMKNAPEVFEMRSETFSFAIRSIQIDRSRNSGPPHALCSRA